METKTPPTTLNFKYSIADTFSFLAKNGSASATGVQLNGTEIPYANIVDTSSRDNRFVLALAPNTRLDEQTAKQLKENRYLVLDIYRVKAQELKKQIDRLGSTVWAQKHCQELTQAGKGNLYYAVVCPHCSATVDLSEAERTTYIYCPYCSSVINHNQQIISNSDTYTVCDECHMYDRVRGYTVFYFYFLLVVYGYSLKRRFVCDTCAESLAKKALLLNFLFLLGIPSSIYMWIKAVSGRDSYFQDLAKANKLARKGKYQEADEIYDKLFSLYPEHPGLLMNKGLGHLHGGDSNGAVGFLTRSLRSCGNYLPTLRLIQGLQQAAQANNARK